MDELRSPFTIIPGYSLCFLCRIQDASPIALNVMSDPSVSDCLNARFFLQVLSLIYLRWLSPIRRTLPGSFKRHLHRSQSKVQVCEWSGVPVQSVQVAFPARASAPPPPVLRPSSHQPVSFNQNTVVGIKTRSSRTMFLRRSWFPCSLLAGWYVKPSCPWSSRVPDYNEPKTQHEWSWGFKIRFPLSHQFSNPFSPKSDQFQILSVPLQRYESRSEF